MAFDWDRPPRARGSVTCFICDDEDAPARIELKVTLVSGGKVVRSMSHRYCRSCAEQVFGAGQEAIDAIS